MKRQHTARGEWSRSGLTMVELMVVVAIIGVLAAIGYPVMSESLANNKAYRGARAVTSEIKLARYRAQNYNRAMGVQVDAVNDLVTSTAGSDNTCASLGTPVDTRIYNVAETFNGDVDILASGGVGQLICIRPNGMVLQDNGLPFTNGTLSFAIGRGDGRGRTHNIVLPFNGVVRLVD